MDKSQLASLLASADTTIKQAMHILNEFGGKIIFVVNENRKLLGTATDGDIRRGIANGLTLTVSIREVMKANFISINRNHPDVLKKAKELMQKHIIEYIPIIDDHGEIVDAVSWIDYFDNGEETRNETFLNNQVVIMAGGKGTRLDPFTKILPKPLIPLGNKPIIEHILDRFYKKGFNRFKLVLNYKKEIIKLYFSDNSFPFDIEFIEEAAYLGTAGGLHLVKGKVDESFIVTNCDTILEGDYKDILNWHKERGNLLTIVGSHREIAVPYGVLHMSNGSLIDINEKPKIDLFINTGTYIFEPELLELLNGTEYLDMDKLIRQLKEKHFDKIGVYPHWGEWFDIGQWDEYRKSLKHIGDDVNV